MPNCDDLCSTRAPPHAVERLRKHIREVTILWRARLSYLRGRHDSRSCPESVQLVHRMRRDQQGVGGRGSWVIASQVRADTLLRSEPITSVSLVIPASVRGGRIARARSGRLYIKKGAPQKQAF